MDPTNTTLTPKVYEFCESFDRSTSATVNATGFDWAPVCIQLALMTIDVLGSQSPLLMVALRNLKYVKVVSERRGYDVQSWQDYENVTRLFGFPVAYCRVTYKRYLDIINCSNILYDYTVGGLAEITTFCEENEEFGNSRICRSTVQFQSMLFNITQYFPINGELAFYSYFYPVAVLLVLVSNVLMVMTFLRGRFLSAAHLLLVAVALMDTLTVVLPVPYLFYYLTLGNYITYISYNHCIAITAILLYVAPICHGVSVWLNCGLAIQRYILLWHSSFTRSSVLRRKFCVLFMFAVIVVVSTIFIPGLMTLTNYPVVYAYSSDNEEIQTTLKSPIVTVSTQFRVAQMYCARSVIIQVIPCVGMLALFIDLVLKWKAAVNANCKMTTSERGCDDLESIQTFNKVVLYMLVVFFLAEIPVAVVAFIVSWDAMNNEPVDDNILVTAFVSNIIILFTSPINLLIYVYQSDCFRHNLKRLLSFQCWSRKSNQSGNGIRTRTFPTEEIQLSDT
ncbi:sex peptide receptor-like [Ylistrum balloti]|uniref:sex peptide receptor-like n=1 Tax=Ylistrum balloti TaxID=509963 RepID=UPI002905DDA3|nr:sex peptide receptor-like [Ylistrum balloti]